MIAVAPTTLDLIGGPRYTTHWRLLVADADGTMRDYSDQAGIDWRKSADWGKTVDAPMADGTVEVFREAGGHSLAPQVEGSTLNRNAAGNYAPAIDIGRRLQVWTQDTAAGAAPIEADWVLVHDAIIQKLGKGSGTLKLSTLDRAALLNRIIRHENVYGTAAGTPVADVMQALIDDTLGVGVFTLALDGDPQYAIAEAGPFTGRSVWDALEALSAEFAGYVEYRDALTLVTPDRTEPTAASAVASIGPDQYKTIPRLDTDLADIRNDIDVTFRNTTTEAIETVNAVDAVSVTAYGEQYMGVTLGEGSAIDTTAEAQDMADRILADLSVPRFSQQVVNWYWFPVELGDHITWKANGRDYDSDQHWAVTGFRHRLDRDKRETVFDVRGAASGGYKRWLRRGDEEPEEPQNLAPTVTPTATQVGDLGQLRLKINDPALSLDSVRFKKHAGAGDFDFKDPTDGTWTTDTVEPYYMSVALQPKHNSFIAWAVGYTDHTGAIVYLTDVVTYDADLIAEPTSVEISFGATGNIVVSAVGDEDTANLYVTAQEGSAPANPTSTTNNGTIAGRTGSMDTGTTCGLGAVAFVKVAAYDANGALGTVASAQLRRGTGSKLPFRLSYEPTQSGDTATLTVDISDPTLAVTAVEFKARRGTIPFGATWSAAWDTATGIAGTDATLTRIESFALSGKHTSELKVRISYTDENGTALTRIFGHTFDADQIAEVTEIVPDIDNAGQVYVSLIGDEDTANLYIRVTTDGTTPTNPTSASNDGSVAGRSGRTAAAGKTGSSGTVVKVKAVGYDSGGVAGPVQSKEWTVPHDGGAERNPAALSSVSVSPMDAATGVDVMALWTVNGSVTDAGHDVEVEYWHDDGGDGTGFVAVGLASEANPVTNTSKTLNHSTGTLSDKYKVLVKLKDANGTVDEKSSGWVKVIQ